MEIILESTAELQTDRASKALRVFSMYLINLPRKKGYQRKIHVSINSQKKCLNIVLNCDINLDAYNYLRAVQYFSKILCLQPGMDDYIVKGRLLEKAA